MKITYSEHITRVVTVEIPDECADMDVSELDSDDAVREIIFDAIEFTGWHHEYCHETHIEVGEHEPTIFLNV